MHLQILIKIRPQEAWKVGLEKSFIFEYLKFNHHLIKAGKQKLCNGLTFMIVKIFKIKS